MTKLWAALQAFKAAEKGATLVEYGIVVALIAVVSIAVVGVLGVDVFSAFDQAQSNVDTSGGPLTPSVPAPPAP